MKTLLISSLVSLILAVGCGSNSNNSANTESSSFYFVAALKSDLPACNAANEGSLAYTESEKTFYTCSALSHQWATMGAASVQTTEVDGCTTITVFYDSNESKALDQNETTVSSSKVCNGVAGATGEKGAAGVDGTNGVNGTNKTAEKIVCNGSMLVDGLLYAASMTYTVDFEVTFLKNESNETDASVELWGTDSEGLVVNGHGGGYFREGEILNLSTHFDILNAGHPDGKWNFIYNSGSLTTTYTDSDTDNVMVFPVETATMTPTSSCSTVYTTL